MHCLSVLTKRKENASPSNAFETSVTGLRGILRIEHPLSFYIVKQGNLISTFK